VGGDGPDHEDVQGDDQQRPERVVGDEQEVGDGAEHGQGDGHRPGPGPARQQPPAGEGHQQAEHQVDPAPGGGVELEQVVAGLDVELVLEDADQALQAWNTPTMSIMIAANRMNPTAMPLVCRPAREYASLLTADSSSAPDDRPHLGTRRGRRHHPFGMSFHPLRMNLGLSCFSSGAGG
jgi:hypothetical protein